MPTFGFGASARLGAAAGAVAVLLYVVGGLLTGTPEDFGGPAAEAVAYFDERRTGIQLGSACFAASAPFLVWFLATVVSLARQAGPPARRAASVAYGCGLVALALFMADVAALAVGALRPENMAAAPQLAAALLDFSFVAIAMASFLTSALFAAFALLSLRAEPLWPGWLGWLALVAALACALRAGTLFTTEGPFTAGGALGFWAPVAAFVGWTLAGSVALARPARN
jgi:hypothetical protein